MPDLPTIPIRPVGNRLIVLRDLPRDEIGAIHIPTASKKEPCIWTVLHSSREVEMEYPRGTRICLPSVAGWNPPEANDVIPTNLLHRIKVIKVEDIIGVLE